MNPRELRKIGVEGQWPALMTATKCPDCGETHVVVVPIGTWTGEEWWA